MSELKGIVHKREFLEGLIDTDKFLFHVTSDKGLDAILHCNQVKNLTVCGHREMHSFNAGKQTKGTASFTENPIQLYEEDHGDLFNGKDVVMVFLRSALEAEGVKKLEYVDECIFRQDWENFMIAPEELEGELEWRSPFSVNIGSSYIGYITVAKRKYVASKNQLIFVD